MISALTITTVVMFGWMLNSADNDMLQLSPQVSPPTSSLPLPPAQENKSSQQDSGKGDRSALRDAKERNSERGQSHARTTGRSGGRSSAGGYSSAYSQQMPTSPTDSSSAAGGGYYQYMPPTSGAAASNPEDDGMQGGAPTSARPGMSRSYSSMQNAQQQNRRMAAARNATASSPQSTQKAFNNYQTNNSSSSAYMNLFRSGNARGTVDNYSTLVKPALDQQRANQQFGADIHGLENSNRVQGLNILRLDRDTQNLNGVNATQYFMNYGDYYRGASGQ